MTALPKISTSLPGLHSRALIERDERVVSPSLTRDYPFTMKRGRGAWVWDADDNKFLDFTCGIGVTNVGHAHPVVNAAIKAQVDDFLHMAGTDFYYEVQVALAEQLARITPGDMPKRVFLTNSGTEAVEGALKLARKHTGRPKVLAFSGAFHGRTYGAMFNVPYGYCYRCPVNLTYPSCNIDCVDFIERMVFGKIADPHEVAAIFVEPMQGEGGYVNPPVEWHQRLRALCDKYGILLVADEVQSGMGRSGEFFMMSHYGIVPDITCVAKGIANGLPLGAIVARADVMDWEPGSHGSTFGGNPVSCAAALATIRVMEEEGCLANTVAMGARLTAGLRQLQQEFPQIGDVRSIGLMVGAELIDPDTGAHAKTLRDTLVNHAFERGFLLLGAGSSTVRFLPPLNVTADEIDAGLDLFAAALGSVTAS
jgi:4-aminobutyrate aminotransferase